MMCSIKTEHNSMTHICDMEDVCLGRKQNESWNYALRQIRGEKAKDPSFLPSGIQVDPPG